MLENFWWGTPYFLSTFRSSWLRSSPDSAFVPESKDPDATPLDPVGAGLSIAGLSVLVYGIIEAPDNGWTEGVTLLAFGIAAVLLAAFVAWELRSKHPMLKISFFKDPRFTAASVAITMIFFAMFGAIFILTQHLQFVLGYSALEAGFRVTPIATLVVGAPIAARGGGTRRNEGRRLHRSDDRCDRAVAHVRRGCGEWVCAPWVGPRALWG